MVSFDKAFIISGDFIALGHLKSALTLTSNITNRPNIAPGYTLGKAIYSVLLEHKVTKNIALKRECLLKERFK